MSGNDRPANDDLEPDEALAELLEEIADRLGLQVEVEVEEADGVLTGRLIGDDVGLFIGRHGQTIDAVQTLASAIVAGADEERRAVVVDAAGYRQRRRRTLEALAGRCAEEVVRTGEPVELEPMSSAERKIVHTALQDHESVTTTSEGEEPNRRVVVEPAV